MFSELSNDLYFHYSVKSYYNRIRKISDYNIDVCSSERFNDICGENKNPVFGEIHNINLKKSFYGLIKINDKWIPFSKSKKHNRLLFKDSDYLETKEGYFIAVLKLRKLPIVLTILLLVSAIIITI